MTTNETFTSPITTHSVTIDTDSDETLSPRVDDLVTAAPQMATQQQEASPGGAVNGGPLDVTCVVSAESSTVLISVIPPEGPITAPHRPLPVDIVCVVDVSGSMASKATVKDKNARSRITASRNLISSSTRRGQLAASWVQTTDLPLSSSAMSLLRARCRSRGEGRSCGLGELQ